MDHASVAELHARVKAREHHVRESWVRAMEARIVREELSRCQRAEGVNSFETCRHLADRYLAMLRDNRIKGYKQVDV